MNNHFITHWVYEPAWQALEGGRGIRPISAILFPFLPRACPPATRAALGIANHDSLRS